MSCKCQKCGKEYKVDLLVEESVWKRISPKKDESGLLCPSCIIEAVEDNFDYDVLYLVTPIIG